MLKKTLGSRKARRLNAVSSTTRLTRAEIRNSEPTTIITVEASHPLRRAAAIRTAAVTSEITASSPLLDSPSTERPWVSKNASPPSRPTTPNTPIAAATVKAPSRWITMTCVSGAGPSAPSAPGSTTRLAGSCTACFGARAEGGRENGWRMARAVIGGPR